MKYERDLANLAPAWTRDRKLTFNCPLDQGCRIKVPTTPQDDGSDHWQWNGKWEFDRVTLSPSIDGTHGRCTFHGYVTDGKVVW